MSKCGYSAQCLIVLCVFAGPALAQEVEPNDTCPGQHVGMPTIPFSLSGSLDTPPDVPDVDFLAFDFTPGDELVVDLLGADSGSGTLSDPLLGLFDSDCNLIAVDDDGAGSLESRLSFSVPDDGVVILAATSYADSAFTGNGFSAGSYLLSIAKAPPLIGSISGRLIDSQTSEPVTGGDPTFATVALVRCDDQGCSQAGFEIPDAQGQFTFSGERYRLRVGEYRLAVSADGYEEGQEVLSEPFQVGAGEQYEFGAFPLEPDQLQIIRTRICDPIASDGGGCTYSLDLRNRDQSPFSGRVWSLVDYYLPSASRGYAFQVGTGNAFTPRPKYLWVEPGDVQRVTFHVPIPPDWAALEDGGYACISAGIGRAPFAVNNVTTVIFIGCLTRAGDDFRPMSQESQHEMRFDVRTAIKASARKGLQPGPRRRPLR